MVRPDKRALIWLPLETLIDIICQLPPEDLMVVKQKAEERLQSAPPTLPLVVNDPHGEFWGSELGRMIIAEADDHVNIEEVRQLLSKLKGSLAADIIAERGER
ncbi:MAG TPA: hypothetical protein VNK89_06550 [Thermoflexus sp.]|nr:hypothetical protein [Thermoflexus sp.]